jgi:hypothetical protein
MENLVTRRITLIKDCRVGSKSTNCQTTKYFLKESLKKIQLMVQIM